MSEEGRKRERASLKAMADVAFDESMKIYRRNRELGDKNFAGYPRPDEMRRAEIFEDISKLLDAIGEVQGDVAELLRRKRAERKADLDEQDAAKNQDMT